jgi:hypothetical protein
MNKFLSYLGGFLSSLFSSARSGLQDWLRENLPAIKLTVREYLAENADKDFHDVKPLVFAYLTTMFPLVPHTWLSIGIDLSYETGKGAAERALQI